MFVVLVSRFRHFPVHKAKYSVKGFQTTKTILIQMSLLTQKLYSPMAKAMLLTYVEKTTRTKSKNRCCPPTICRTPASEISQKSTERVEPVQTHSKTLRPQVHNPPHILNARGPKEESPPPKTQPCSQNASMLCC